MRLSPVKIAEIRPIRKVSEYITTFSNMSKAIISNSVPPARVAEIKATKNPIQKLGLYINTLGNMVSPYIADAIPLDRMAEIKAAKTPIEKIKLYADTLKEVIIRIDSGSVPPERIAKIRKAENIVNKHTAISGGLGLALSQIIFGIDSLIHISNNNRMIRNIAQKIYHSKVNEMKVAGYSTISSAGAIIVKTAISPVAIIPIVGNAVNTVVSAGMTKAIGENFIRLCEKDIATVVPKKLIA